MIDNLQKELLNISSHLDLAFDSNEKPEGILLVANIGGPDDYRNVLTLCSFKDNQISLPVLKTIHKEIH